VSKTILIFDVDSLGFSTEHIVSDIESFFGNIDWSLDDLESLPTDFGLLVVLAMGKMIECRKFFTIENRSLLPPGKLSKYIVFDEERETLSLHRLEPVVGRRGKL